MASNVKQAFGTLTSFLDTGPVLSTLGPSPTAAWQSDGVDNGTTDLFLDALVYLHLASAGYGTAPGNTVYIFAFGSIDGSNYTTQGNGLTGPTGTNAAITVPNVTSAPINLIPLGTATLLGTAAQNIGPFSVARAFGGIMPVKWGIVIVNNTAVAFVGAVAKYQGVFSTVG